jgi:methionyl aminopeptidase
MIYIKSLPEIEKMRKACKLTKRAMEYAAQMLRPGVTTLAINDAVHEFIVKNGGRPSFLNYRSFPKSVCISVNDQILHGIPSAGTKLRDGDVVSIDVGVNLDGFNGDMARTFPVGNISAAAKRLIEVTERCFFEGASHAKHGLHLSLVINAMADCAERNGYSMLRGHFGHGIGKKLHESPDIPCHRVKNKGPRLARGMTLAVEPMVCQMHHEAYTAEDGWTVITVDGGLTAHYENTLLVTDGEPEFMTL